MVCVYINMSVHEESFNAAEEFTVFLKSCPAYCCLYDAGLTGCIYNCQWLAVWSWMSPWIISLCFPHLLNEDENSCSIRALQICTLESAISVPSIVLCVCLAKLPCKNLSCSNMLNFILEHHLRQTYVGGGC